VSYLIIIGDLMPQVIGSVFPGSAAAVPFLLDRQFWITAFMYHLPRWHGLSLGLLLSRCLF
jgi:amino acid permease